MDAIQVIRRDHRTIEHLFTRFERAERAGDEADQRAAAREIVRELSVHAAIEEQFLYPALRRAGAARPVLDALEEHHAAKLTLDELDALEVRHERFAPKVAVLVQSVRAHVDEEERQLLPELERALDAEELRALGAVLERAKGAAPTRPHPAAPDTPPGVFVAGAAAAVVDRSRDALRGSVDILRLVAERAVEAARRFLLRGAGSGRRTVRGARARGREVAEEAGEALDAVATVGGAAVADVRARGREVLDDVRERGRDALGEVVERGGAAGERGLRRVDGRLHAVARDVRERGRGGSRAAGRKPRRGGKRRAKAARGKRR